MATKTEDLLWKVREASCCLMCADGSSCSEPAFCREEAARYIAAANESLADGPVRVTVIGRGQGEIAEVTSDACLVVAVDGAGLVTAVAPEVTA